MIDGPPKSININQKRIKMFMESAVPTWDIYSALMIRRTRKRICSTIEIVHPDDDTDVMKGWGEFAIYGVNISNVEWCCCCAWQNLRSTMNVICGWKMNRNGKWCCAWIWISVESTINCVVCGVPFEISENHRWKQSDVRLSNVPYQSMVDDCLGQLTQKQSIEVVIRMLKSIGCRRKRKQKFLFGKVEAAVFSTA